VYAVKAIPLLNKGSRKRALHEASLLRTLDHPYIRRFVDCFEENKHVHIVLEYIDGCDLSDYIVKNGVLDETLALTIMRQMLDALRYCHGQQPPVIHRDVKPENMMLSTCRGEYEVKLIDFGLAVRGHSWICRGKTMTGTPVYISPEANLMRTHTPASDIWAIGVVLHAMLTRSFVPADVRAGHKTFTVRSSSQMSPNASNILQGLLQLDPNQRLTAAEAFKHPWFQEQLLCTSVPWVDKSIRKPSRKIQNKRLSAQRGLALKIQAFAAFDEEAYPLGSDSTRTSSTPGGADESIKDFFLDA